jgi:hypothetical protein
MHHTSDEFVMLHKAVLRLLRLRVSSGSNSNWFPTEMHEVNRLRNVREATSLQVCTILCIIEPQENAICAILPSKVPDVDSGRLKSMIIAWITSCLRRCSGRDAAPELVEGRVKPL